MIVFEQCLSSVERCAVLVCIHVDHFQMWQSCEFGMIGKGRRYVCRCHIENVYYP